MSKKLIYLTSFVLVLALVLSSVANAAIPGLIGWWKFDEGTGDIAYDSSVYGNDGTLFDDPQWVDGIIDGALDLDGDYDHVSIDAVADDITTNNFTVSVWFKTTQTGQGNLFASNAATGTHEFEFGVNGGNMWIDDGSVTEFPADVNDDQWHFAAYVRDGSTGYVYVDGILQGTDLATGDPASDIRWSIGQEWDSNPSDEFTGMVDDARFYNRPLTEEEIQQVMMGKQPGMSSNPSPWSGAPDVPREVVLSWTPGEFAPATNGHTVYFSENFDDVNDGIGGITQNDTSYTLAQRLNLATTYYWRVDEVNGPPDYTVHQGRVWSFTTELIAYPVENITATASSSGIAQGPENTVNGSGLDDSGLLHGKLGDDNMWLSSLTGVQPTWVQYEFDKVYKLQEMWVWNFNESWEPMIGVGLKDVTIEYSVNGTDYTSLGTTHEFAQAPGTDDYAHNTIVNFSGVPAKYVRLTPNSNFGGIINQYGLSEVRFFHEPIHAREPNPADGATDVSIGTLNVPADVTLSFYAGREAAKHNVYFSSDEQAVMDGTAPVTTVSELSYGPLSLGLDETYYWRVDEVNEAETPAIWQGDLWDFTTQEYFIVDDFESYNELDPTEPESNNIFLTWIDGYEQLTNGAIVGYADSPFAERGIVHSGKQVMPYYYDNAGTANYSEAERTFSPVQDWTRKGVGVLSLWFRGYPAYLGSFVEAPAGTYTMTASGEDIYGASDELHFAYKELSGAGAIIAKVESVENTDPWAKAGVMIRDTLEPDSKNASVLVTPENGVRFQYRNIAGGITNRYFAEGITAPQWVRLERTAGGLVRAYYSADGTAWTMMNMTVVSMNMPVYIGLAVTSHNVDAMCEAKFSNVSFPNTDVVPQWTDQGIGMPIQANETESMYVTVTDGSGTAATVYHDDPDATLLDIWTEWYIDLKEFGDAGVVLTDVSKLAIGLGDKSNPQPGGLGQMYFDDIRLCLLAPLPPAN
jgi:hypothetical protein